MRPVDGLLFQAVRVFLPPMQTSRAEVPGCKEKILPLHGWQNCSETVPAGLAQARRPPQSPRRPAAGAALQIEIPGYVRQRTEPGVFQRRTQTQQSSFVPGLIAQLRMGGVPFMLHAGTGEADPVTSVQIYGEFALALVSAITVTFTCSQRPCSPEAPRA